MKKHVKTERKKNLKRSYSHISLKECKIISRKYNAQGLAGCLLYMLSRLRVDESLRKELELLHISGFRCWELHSLH